jgi:hypothetical protein
MTQSTDTIDHGRRSLIGAAAVTLAATEFGLMASAQSGAVKLPAIKPGAHTSFGPLKQIEAGTLNIGYLDAGPASGAETLLFTVFEEEAHNKIDPFHVAER